MPHALIRGSYYTPHRIQHIGAGEWFRDDLSYPKSLRRCTGGGQPGSKLA